MNEPNDGNAEPIPDADLPPGESAADDPQATDDVAVPAPDATPAEPEGD